MSVTIKDVAAKCCMSISTVSKAFNNYSDISEQTRELVHKAAKEIGYFPSAIARTLKTNRSYNLGVLFQAEGRNGLTHGFFAGVLDAFKREGERVRDGQTWEVYAGLYQPDARSKELTGAESIAMTVEL